LADASYDPLLEVAQARRGATTSERILLDHRLDDLGNPCLDFPAGSGRELVLRQPLPSATFAPLANRDLNVVGIESRMDRVDLCLSLPSGDGNCFCARRAGFAALEASWSCGRCLG